MDNGGAHKKKTIKETIEKTGNYLQYSVPYKPKTNAVESWFNQFKYHFQQESNIYTYPKLRRKVKKVIKKIPKNTLL